MTSEERHERRYQRRKAQREQKLIERNNACGSFDEVFSFRHLYLSGKKSAKNVRWKASTQKYLSNLIANTSRTRMNLQNDSFQHGNFYQFDIMERGKKRHIRSVHISERVVQKCLCDYCIVPIFSSAFIYDNSASIKNRGMDFALRRFKRHLQEHYKRYGTKGYILFYDFHDYFNSAPHEPIFQFADQKLQDKRTINLFNDLIADFTDCGLGLGSQVSQTSALLLPNELDHYCKEVLHIRGYGRYMDDGYLIHSDKNYLENVCMSALIAKAAEIGLSFSEKKTVIIPIDKGVRFLKTKFVLSSTGKVTVTMRRLTTISVRKKLRKFVPKLRSGIMTYDDLRSSYNSYLGHMQRGNSKTIIAQTNQYFKKLFGFYPNKKGWEVICMQSKLAS